MRARKVAIFAIVAGSFALGAAAGQANEDDAATELDTLLTRPITPAAITVCHGFNCRYRSVVSLTNRDISEMTRLMRGGRASPEAERKALGALMAWFDRRIGPQVGTVNHVAAAGADHVGSRDQFDCVDTTTNTVQVLRELERLKLLVHHRPGEPVSRMMPPHATAVVVDVGSRERWAVDGWVRAYGEQPVITPVRAWLDMPLP